MTATVNVRSRTPYFYPGPVFDAEGKEIQPATYAGLMCNVDVILPDGVRSGQQVVELAETATDEQIKAAVLALYGLTPE